MLSRSFRTKWWFTTELRQLLAHLSVSIQSLHFTNSTPYASCIEARDIPCRCGRLNITLQQDLNGAGEYTYKYHVFKSGLTRSWMRWQHSAPTLSAKLH